MAGAEPSLEKEVVGRKRNGRDGRAASTLLFRPYMALTPALRLACATQQSKPLQLSRNCAGKVGYFMYQHVKMFIYSIAREGSCWISRRRGSSSVDCSIIFICTGDGVQVVAQLPSAGPVPPPTSVLTARYRFVYHLRAYVVHMTIYSSCSNQQAFSSYNLSIKLITLKPKESLEQKQLKNQAKWRDFYPNDHIRTNSIHDIRIARFSNGNNEAIFDTNICLENSSIINDHCIGYYSIKR
ncbi:hypothetical protein SDJN02_25496 [Cucurbita argyrosperma subsp. argyrosperma]|nr:hypothetical protein SDJN02_25496 [Cucurbita argyrosperma subsp. argyrosperma]